jgi:hypothetical protein
MYAKESKAWIAREAIHPRIIKTFDSFKSFWAAKITLVNQAAIPASQYGYGMAATTNNDFIVSCGETIANFGTVYPITQESIKLQGTMITSMQSQLNAMSQYCMVLQQQPVDHLRPTTERPVKMCCYIPPTKMYWYTLVQTVIALAHRYRQTTNNVDRELTKLP